ncbi:hypothetical protein [Streptomyces sp. NPDC046197]|uniref:hypothetical protein n=1 Tax=Streptomyces sp. NPDC046197 TaxID=3154337 RepID=UPI0033D83A2A
MVDHRDEAPGENGAPVPRDMPDQQSGAGEDPWEVTPEGEGAEAEEEDHGSAGPADDVPDTDVAGTGRKGAAHSGAVHPEHPVPDEPSD